MNIYLFIYLVGEGQKLVYLGSFYFYIIIVYFPPTLGVGPAS